MRTHRIIIGHVTRELPIREVKPGVSVALLNVLGDWQLTEAAGAALVRKLPKNVEVLVMPDGKAQALLHVMGRLSGLPTIIARKEKKPYMDEPIVGVSVQSITTQRKQELFLGADDVDDILCGRRVAIVDDVVSSGGTLVAMQELMNKAGSEIVAIMAIATEGTPRKDVISIFHLPLF